MKNYEDMKADEELRKMNEPDTIRHPGDLRDRLEDASRACLEACRMLDDLWTRGVRQAQGLDAYKNKKACDHG
jgi:uncharacterized protein with von Willebrand factor type A (vWA) domain